jgi:predicted nucleic acid-binding protein
MNQQDIHPITIVEELRYFIPPLQPEEKNQLETNILFEGCRHALLVWKTTAKVIDEKAAEPLQVVNVLIDGHNRYDICRKHGLEFPVQWVDFTSLQMAKNYMIEQQLGRRNLNPEQMAYLRGLRYHQDKLLKGKYDRKKNSSHNDHYDNPLSNHAKTIEKVADLFQVSPKTIQRDAEFAQGLEKLSVGLRQDVLSGAVRVPKKQIQQLAKISLDKPLVSLEEIFSVNHTPAPIKTERIITQPPVSTTNDLSDMVRKCVPNALDFDLTLQVKGRFLMDNQLTEVWKKLRGFDEQMVIDESFTDTISIYQAPYLGLM